MRKILLLAALLASCEGGFTAPRDGEEQTWEYTAYSAAGAPVVSGTFVIRAEGRDFTGTWATALLQPNANVGPQVGTGELRGSWDIEAVHLLRHEPGLGGQQRLPHRQPIGDALSGIGAIRHYSGMWPRGPFSLAGRTDGTTEPRND
jgi:hypothetical protein